MQASQRVAQIPWWVSPQPKTKVATKPKSKRKVARRKRAPSFVVFVAVASLFAAAVMVNVSENALIAQDTVEMEYLKKELQIEQALREDLLIKRAELQAPERVEAIAVRKMGMIKPVQVEYLILPEVPNTDVRTAQSSSSKGNATQSQGEVAALPPILGEIVQKVKITALGDSEKDL